MKKIEILDLDHIYIFCSAKTFRIISYLSLKFEKNRFGGCGEIHVF